MLEKRNIAVEIILTIVTCGIYGIVWFIRLTNDVKSAAGDEKFQSGGVAFLLTLITCGIYGIYWAYKMGELMKEAETKHGTEVKDNSIIYLILELFGLGIVVYALVQSDLNAIAEKENPAPVEPTGAA